MNFYEKVPDQSLHNKVYLVNFIVRYVYFINIENGSHFPYINSNQIQYKALNSLIANNFLRDQVSFNY